MPIPVPCPACGARLTAPDAAAGQTIKCPKCAAGVAVPVIGSADDYEVVEDAPRTARVVAARPVSKARPVEDADDRPRRRPSRDDEDDGDEDDRPRRRDAKKKGLPVVLLAAAGGGVLFVIVAGVLVWAFAFRGTTPGGGLAGGAPPGFTEVGDDKAGFRVLLPGQVGKADTSRNTVSLPPGAELHAYVGTDGNVQVHARAMKPAGAFNPGTSPDQLYGLLKTFGGAQMESPWNEVVSKTPVTLGGKPGLEVRVKYKPDWMGHNAADDDSHFQVPPGLPPEMRKQWEDDMKNAKKTRDDIRKKNQGMTTKRDQGRELYLVTTDGKRVVVIHLTTTGDFPDAATMKTITDSFAFTGRS